MAMNNTACITSSTIDAQWDRTKIPQEMAGLPAIVQGEDYPEALLCGLDAAAGKPSTLNVCVAEVLKSLNQGPLGSVALVMVGENQFAAEHRNEDGDITVVVSSTKGNIKGAVVRPGNRFNSIPTLPDKKADMIPIYAVYLGLITMTDMLDETARQTARDALDTFGQSLDPYNEIHAIHLLNMLLVRGFEEGVLPCKITGGNINLLTEESVETSFDKGTVICGDPQIVAKNTASACAQASTAGEAKALFASYAEAMHWTPEEEKLIPTFPDDYPVMPETLMIARSFVESRSNKRPMNNHLWRGITSYGKSTGVEMLAYILHTPLLRITCSSNMEAQDFISQFVPDNDSEAEAPVLPGIEEIMYDPESAYEAITGSFLEGATSQDALTAYGNACRAARTGSGNARFKLVESNYVRALRNGYICEVQEMSRVKDAGTMVTLNEFDRANARIPLADGTTAVRHPNAMVIYTDNIGYASCRQVDPSVMRRMDCVYDSYELDPVQVKKRVMYNTGFTDEAKLEAMVKVWNSIIEYCRANEITEGEISVNELERWVDVYQIEGPRGYRDACRRCVISKASPDRATQEEIWTQAALPLIEAE